MEEAIIELLINAPGITAANVYTGRMPQNVSAFPVVVLYKTGSLPNYTYGGVSGWAEDRIQIDIYGRDYLSTKTTARAVIAALSGHRGQASGGVDIQGIFVNAERDLPAIDEDDEVLNLYRTSTDFTVQYHN